MEKWSSASNDSYRRVSEQLPHETLRSTCLLFYVVATALLEDERILAEQYEKLINGCLANQVLRH